jgi:hypothetical protein
MHISLPNSQIYPSSLYQLIKFTIVRITQLPIVVGPHFIYKFIVRVVVITNFLATTKEEKPILQVDYIYIYIYIYASITGFYFYFLFFC